MAGFKPYAKSDKQTFLLLVHPNKLLLLPLRLAYRNYPDTVNERYHTPGQALDLGPQVTPFRPKGR